MIVCNLHGNANIVQERAREKNELIWINSLNSIWILCAWLFFANTYIVQCIWKLVFTRKRMKKKTKQNGMHRYCTRNENGLDEEMQMPSTESLWCANRTKKTSRRKICICVQLKIVHKFVWFIWVAFFVNAFFFFAFFLNMQPKMTVIPVRALAACKNEWKIKWEWKEMT